MGYLRVRGLYIAFYISRLTFDETLLTLYCVHYFLKGSSCVVVPYAIADLFVIGETMLWPIVVVI